MKLGLGCVRRITSRTCTNGNYDAAVVVVAAAAVELLVLVDTRAPREGEGPGIL
jgi:hypothetical protein